jgi:hypothetical protein
MQRQGIPSWHKLEELCDMSHGYLAHLIEDRHELPTPVYYFSAHLGQSVDETAAELVMELLKELVKRRERNSEA